jgi:hypothetical protein
MARERYEDEEDDRPRRRRDEDDDDDDDRPRRKKGGDKGPLDSTFANTNIVVLIIFGLCCGIIAFALSLVGYLTAKDAKAKSNAMIVLIISGIMTVVNLIAAFSGALGGIGGAGGGR